MTRIVYAPGTTVDVIATGREITKGVVTSVILTCAGPQYAVSGNTWFDHTDLVFIADPTKESLAEATHCILTEGEAEDLETEGLSELAGRSVE